MSNQASNNKVICSTPFKTMPVSGSSLATPGIRHDRHVSHEQTMIIKVLYVE